MPKQSRISLYALVTLLTLIANLIFPAFVLADDETPTPVVTEETNRPEKTDIPSEESETPSQEPTDESAPAPVSEILEQLPENTEVIVLDENGEALPLATKEAKEIVQTGDPIWCVDGTPPNPADPNCSPAFANMTDLLNWITINNPNQAGTIWIEDSYDSSVNDPALISFDLDGSVLTNMANHSLTFQGGWNGIFGSTTITGTSEFNTMISITNWNANVTLNNIFSTGVSNSSIFIETTGDVSLNNITSNNNDFGIEIYSDNVTFDNVIANENIDGGAYIEATGDVLVKSSQFNNNDDTGLLVDTTGKVTLNNVIANKNSDAGVIIFATGEVSVKNSQFNNNDYAGIMVDTAGNITLNNVIANQNLGIGADLYNCGCLGMVGINVIGTNVFNYNTGIGLLFYTDGSTYIENTTANYNGIGGIGGDAVGDITFFNVTANNNLNGLGFTSLGKVNIECSTITNNSMIGVTAFVNNLNFIGSNISNNGLDYLTLGGVINIFDHGCNVSTATGKSKPTSGLGLPLNIVFGNSANLDCELYSGTVLILPNGDKVTFNCPIGDFATLERLENNVLPSAVPEEFEYASGIVTTTIPTGNDVALNGLVVVSFVIPEDIQGEDLTILYWDGIEWLDLDTATFEDGRKIFNGGYISEDGYFETLTNFSGHFVLVKK